ncbi:FGGY-family carbohydrate kinase [uncultured Brachyspira sp.]|uniref:FGGY-family carbohydrate kinase n=1 Tax=uncultured Brachyspira sp. TaxID=221953 RepID=UPI00261CFB8A|nr:FGGY-family carbohydrate kinase [uncultured Brachyspira sp.]
MQYYIGLDNGGTTTKAALYDEFGNEIAIASTDTNVINPKPGFTERDMEEMWEANCKIISQVIEMSKINPKDIAALACCGHGKGLYLWGKDNKPSYNGIISTDNRAWKYVTNWKENGIEKEVFKLSYQHIMPCQPVALLSWFKDNDINVINNTKYIFECKDYIRFRLTGEANAEITDYSGSNLLNLNTKNYDDELLKLFDLSIIKDKLPPIKNSTDICGYITKEAAQKTGLLEGTPVAGGMFDIDACAIAAGLVNEDNVCMIAGTWSINEYIRKDAVLDGSVLMNSVFCMPEYYLIEESSATSAGNFEWFLKNIFGDFVQNVSSKKDLYKKIDEEIDSVSIKDFCPIFHPFLMASNVHPNAKASIIGMNNYHTRAHLFRGMYEGIAFSHRFHLDKLKASRNKPIKSIKLAGGVARSKVWSSMFSDIMGIDIDVIDIMETGAFGCAIACSVASGQYKTLEEAAEKMVKIANTIKADKDKHEIYSKKYKLYKQTLELLDSLWDNIDL